MLLTSKISWVSVKLGSFETVYKKLSPRISMSGEKGVGIKNPEGKAVVALVRSGGHREGVLKALRLIEDQVAQDIRGKKKVLVKPNFVSARVQLSATPVEAVRAVLDLVTRYHSGKIIIAEGPAISTFQEGLRNFGYLGLRDEYEVEFIDLNEDEPVEVEILDSHLKPISVHVAKTVAESDYRISVTRPKTHDVVIVTLSIKNMAVGSLLRGEKSRIHQGYKAINLNLARISRLTLPHLGVIDGFIGMEGNGPVSGTPINFGIAAASTDPVALDAAVAEAMGFNPRDVGYLHYLNEWGMGTLDPGKIEMRGAPLKKVKRGFNPHFRYREQLQWR